MMTKKLLVIASLLLASTAGSMVASAQDVPDEHTDKNLPGVDDTTDGENAPNTPNGIVEKDPTEHFNFAGHWFSYRKYDELGGTFGDGKMIDPKTGKQVMEEKEVVDE